jgi:tripartite ATP-independent transporter DctM subunit
MLILYGPLAGLPIPKLFTAAMLPGLVLSGLYLLYIGIVCAVRPELGPSVPPEERAIPRLKLLTMVMVNIFPFLLIVVAVLGSIIFGIAAPTEAAGVGALCCLCLAAAYREISWGRLKDAVYETMMISTFILTITVAANIFGGVFLALGGGKIIESFLLGLPVGPYGILAVVLVMVFIMGFFLDWIPILLIFTPILAPIIPKLGFDPLWFGILFAVCLQTSFLTPPFAVSIFYLKGIAPPEVELSHIYKGVVPFIILQLIGLALCIVFPQIVLWLPSVVYG